MLLLLRCCVWREWDSIAHGDYISSEVAQAAKAAEEKKDDDVDGGLQLACFAQSLQTTGVQGKWMRVSLAPALPPTRRCGRPRGPLHQRVLPLRPYLRPFQAVLTSRLVTLFSPKCGSAHPFQPKRSPRLQSSMRCRSRPWPRRRLLCR